MRYSFGSVLESFRALPTCLFVASAVMILVAGCGPGTETDTKTETEPAAVEQLRAELDLSTWRPFTKGSVWNLKLPPQRQEVVLPAAGLAVAPMAVDDGDYGIKIYFARASDPTWSITFDDYNSVTDVWSPANPATLRAPAGMVPPTGGDGTVILVDENQKYVYELWQLKVTRAPSMGSPKARCASVNVSDLRSTGIHRNVGITAAGLPGVGGLLRTAELTGTLPIRHKLWLALHSELLLGKIIWPANQLDSTASGGHAALRFGDVVALAKSYDVENGKCKLSPMMRRIAHVLQDFGGIVQDRGGDSVGLVAEVGALSKHLDITEAAMWTQFACMRTYLIRVNSPWTGALQGGLGY